MELDLDDYESVLNFTENVKDKLDVPDVVLLNGVVNIVNYQTSKSGHERVLQVNYCSEALLALELLPLLEATAAKRGTPSRLTIVGSQAQNSTSVAKKAIPENEGLIAYLDNKVSYAGLTRYSGSKLLVSAFVQELAQRVSGKNVIVNNVCPGLVATGFDAHLPPWLKPIMFVFRKLQARDVDEGARSLLRRLWARKRMGSLSLVIGSLGRCLHEPVVQVEQRLLSINWQS